MRMLSRVTARRVTRIPLRTIVRSLPPAHSICRKSRASNVIALRAFWRLRLQNIISANDLLTNFGSDRLTDETNRVPDGIGSQLL